MFSLNFLSSLSVIRVNLPHPLPSLYRYSLFLCLWCRSIFVNFYFPTFFNLKLILYEPKRAQNNVTYQNHVVTVVSLSHLSNTFDLRYHFFESHFVSLLQVFEVALHPFSSL